MNNVVFDASAILALFFNEPGKKKVKMLLSRSNSIMSSVNLAEVVSKIIDNETNADEVLETIEALEIEIVPFDVELALSVATLRRPTAHLGLSLGDRACIALAIREKATAVTSEKSWLSLANCRVELIR